MLGKTGGNQSFNLFQEVKKKKKKNLSGSFRSCKLSLMVLIGLKIKSVKINFHKGLCVHQSIKSGQRCSAAF